MNHLAHLLLSGRPGPLMLGNLMGDFVRGPVEDLDLPEEIRAGVRLHRRIDAYSDRHPVFRRSRARLASPYRRYAPVIIDMAYDHYLARNWERFSQQDLQTFSTEVLRLARAHADLLPARLQRFIDALETHRVFEAYATRDGMAAAFRGLSQRMRRDNPLTDAVAELDRVGADLETDFLDFFPELEKAVRCWAPETGVRPAHRG